MPGGTLSFHYLPELAQTHVHWVGDAIQPSHPLSLLLLLPSIFPSIRVFSSELAFHIRWPKYRSFSFSINIPVSEYSGLSWISLQSKGLSRVFCSITVQKHFTSRFFLSAKGPGKFLWASVSLTIKIWQNLGLIPPWKSGANIQNQTLASNSLGIDNLFIHPPSCQHDQARQSNTTLVSQIGPSHLTQGLRSRRHWLKHLQVQEGPIDEGSRPREKAQGKKATDPGP